MITVITGLTGSGKTWFMVNQLLLPEWKKGGAMVYANFPLTFPGDNENTKRWHNLDELYFLNNGIIAIDEGQKLFDAHRWGSLPVSFAEKIAQHRKHFLDIYTTTQDFFHIDIRVRDNVHELYNCQSVLRFPRNDRVYPIFQIIKVIRKQRFSSADGSRVNWVPTAKKTYFISRYWTKEFYNTYGDIGFQRFLCRIKREKRKWRGKIYSRNLINRGKARL